MPAAELPSVLARQGRHLLRAMLVAHSVRFEWRESQLPAAAEAHGRAIPMSSCSWTACGRCSSSKDLEAAVPSLQTVFARAERFSQKVRPLSLTDAERKVLALIDGRNTVQALVERTGLPAAEVVHVVHRLGEVALISKTVSAGARSVMILDGDVEGIRRPFAKWLSGRPKPFELVSLEGEKDLAGAVLRERPSMVVIDASVAGHAAESLAQQIGGGHEAASLTLVAFLDAPMPARTGLLLSAGYDAVLAKPVQFKDIEALLGS